MGGWYTREKGVRVMNWQHFQTYNEAPTRAFESMCNQLFELWCKKTYADSLKAVTIVNGSGGDGGVESFAIKKDDTIIGMQAKWFLNSISTSQFGQISNSINTALRVRPLIKKYIVCIPRDLSSDRIGKGKKVIEDTELNRWQKLKNKLEDDYPGLEIELWNETQLLTILQGSDATGIYRYWFEKSEISKELIVYSYEKQKSGWLSQKYTPCLHIQGQMQKNILKFVGTLDERQSCISTLNVMGQQCSKFLKACDDYFQFVHDHSSQEQLIHEIQRTQEQVIKLLVEIKFAIDAVNNDQQVASSINEDNWYIDFAMLLELLKQNEQFRGNYFHINEIKKTAEALQKNEIHTIISDIRFQLDNKKYLILGNPGSGKTHGIANLVESLLNEKLHIPILIRAKDVNPNNNWIDILKKSLGLASVWNEKELWQALEALSYRTEINNIATVDTVVAKIIPKILICIEGVDESRPYDLWYDRLREIEAICLQYPRLRFCITSRPYVFRELAYDDSLLSNTLRLPSDGDVPVNELYQEYIEFFHVNIERCSWIKWSLKTPLALRIFCENYKYKRISGVEKSSVTITNLLSQKFHIIEKEFNSKYETGYGDRELIVQNSLLAIARKFLINTTLNRNDLIDSLKDIPGLISVAHDYRRKLIDFTEDYGILQSYTVNSETILEPPNTYYSIGVQPFFDYMLALLITNQIQDPSKVTLTETLVGHEGALQMVSILLLEDYSYLITENGSFRDSLSNGELFDLVCFSLSNVSPNSASKYIPFVKKMMNYNSDCLKNVVNKIVLSVSRIENHPLGAQMLHEHLMGYEVAGKRDIIWSEPSYLRYQGDAPWKGHTKVNLTDKRYELYSEDKHNGIPLVYAWMLTTVNNIERVGYRRELMKWASTQPFEFYTLFEHTWCTNDPQMKEDLFAIAMGTVFMLEKGHPCIKLFSDWMIKNIFAPDKISMYYNCAIRYYSRAIVERSYAFGDINDEDVGKSRPPYHTIGTIPLNREATSGTRMGGFGPIDYDLARYVLCDPMDRMFFSRRSSDKTAEGVDYTWYFSEKDIEETLTNEEIVLNEKCRAKLKEIRLAHKKKRGFWDRLDDLIDDDSDTIISNSKSSTYIYNKKADSFLLEHACILEMEALEPNQFVLSAAYAYILLQGWNEEEFYGHPNGGKPGEVIGVDIAIMRQHHPATHGSKSSIMTFCEKYTWCALNEILGYLSDRLPFRDFEREASLLNDYGLLDDFPNPAQELYQENPDCIMEKNSWFIPEELSPLISENIGQEAIRDWIINAPTPNFEKWIDICDFNHEIVQKEKKNWISLYSFNFMSNTLGGESLMWISSAIITKEHFKYFENDIINRKDSLVYDLSNPEELHSSTETQCYITPKEICWMNWKNECYNKIYNLSIDDGDFVHYTIEKAVEECTANYPEFGDVYYKLPSRIIRELLGICDGDGYKYYNGEKQLEAIRFEAGEKWHDSQSFLCVDREKLFLQLDRLNFKIFWTVRLLRQATSKALEKYPKLRSRNDKCWLVWFENGELRTQLFSDQVD
jgi:hypothetical protein